MQLFKETEKILGHVFYKRAGNTLLVGAQQAKNWLQRVFKTPSPDGVSIFLYHLLKTPYIFQINFTFWYLRRVRWNKGINFIF